MKRILSSIVLILYCLAFFKTVIPCLEYILNYDFISEVLCVNKEKKEKDCNGKSYLNEKISKASEETNNDQKKVRISETEKFPVIINESEILKNESVNKKNISGYQFNKFYVSGFISQPMSPPPQV